MPDIFAENPYFAELDAWDDHAFGHTADFVLNHCGRSPGQRKRSIEEFESGEIHRIRAENAKNRRPGWGPEVVCSTCGKDVYTRADGQPRRHKCEPIDNPEAIIHQSHPDLVEMDRRINGVLHTARARLDAELARVDALITAAETPAMRTVTKAYRLGVLAARDDITHMALWHRDRPDEGTLPGLAELRAGTSGISTGPLRTISEVAIGGHDNGIALAIGALIAAHEGA